MTRKLQDARQSEAPSDLESRTRSYTRFRSPTQRDALAGAGDAGPGSHAPSTLPPAPFELESDVTGHEWWLESHMNAASDILCLEQLVDAARDTADVLAIDRAGALIERLGEVRDAL